MYIFSIVADLYLFDTSIAQYANTLWSHCSVCKHFVVPLFSNIAMCLPYCIVTAKYGQTFQTPPRQKPRFTVSGVHWVYRNLIRLILTFICKYLHCLVVVTVLWFEVLCHFVYKLVWCVPVCTV